MSLKGFLVRLPSAMEGNKVNIGISKVERINNISFQNDYLMKNKQKFLSLRFFFFKLSFLTGF